MFPFLAYQAIKAIHCSPILIRYSMLPLKSNNLNHYTFLLQLYSNLLSPGSIYQDSTQNPNDSELIIVANSLIWLIYTGDGLVSNITQQMLHTQITRNLSIKYVSDATGNKALQ